MKISIAYSPDPIYMDDFIYNIIKNYADHISLVIQTEGKILKRGGKLAQLRYYNALIIILGLFKSILNYRKMEKSHQSNKIEELCSANKIQFQKVKSINSKECIEFLRREHLDLIFNQSQHIVKKEVIDIPRIGVLNRHGAYLPKYRGRLAPFWQLLNKEEYGGLTYHLLDEEIDNGPIVYQERIEIEKNENVDSLTRKMFNKAIDSFSTVIEILSMDNWYDNLIPNPKSVATYYTSPGIIDAVRYRIVV
jgi:methionyl-tRNA formyltransferase